MAIHEYVAIGADSNAKAATINKNVARRKTNPAVVMMRK